MNCEPIDRWNDLLERGYLWFQGDEEDARKAKHAGTRWLTRNGFELTVSVVHNPDGKTILIPQKARTWKK